MMPSSAIVGDAARVHCVVDSTGRRLSVRTLTALDKLRLLKAAGPELAMNQAWLAMALLATSVTAIDDVPVPSPMTEHQIEASVARLGDAGIDAVAADLEAQPTATSEDEVKTAGNLRGTLS